jgi:hypothetical protein
MVGLLATVSKEQVKREMARGREHLLVACALVCLAAPLVRTAELKDRTRVNFRPGRTLNRIA